MTRSTRGHERSVLNTRRGIDMALFERELDELLVKLLDSSTDPIAKVVPGSPRAPDSLARATAWLRSAELPRTTRLATACP